MGKMVIETFRKHIGIVAALLSSSVLTGEDILLSIAGHILHPLAILLWNAVCVTLFTLVALLVIRPPFTADGRSLLWLIVGGLLCGSGSMLCTLGIIMSTPGDAVALFFTLPVVTTLFQIIIRKEEITLLKCCLALFSAAGAILVAQPTFLFSEAPIRDTASIVGIILSSVSPFVFSIGMIITAGHHVHSLYTLFSFTLGEIPLSVILCVIFRAPIFPLKLESAGFMILVALEYFVGYMLFFVALSIEETSTVSIILSPEVVLTSVVQYLVLAIPLNWKSILGSCLITATCVGTALSSKKTTISEKGEAEKEELVAGK